MTFLVEAQVMLYRVASLCSFSGLSYGVFVVQIAD